MENLFVLFLFDDKEETTAIKNALLDDNIRFSYEFANHESEIGYLLKQIKFDLILSDYKLKKFDGLTALKIVQRIDPDIPFIFVSDSIGEELAVSTLIKGATDFILKDRLIRLLPAIKRAIKEARNRKEKKLIEKKLRDSEERYRNLIQSVSDIVYKIDENGIFTFISDAVRSIGYKPEDLIGQHYSIIIHPNDLPYVSRDIILPKYKGQQTGDEKAPKLFDERRTGNRSTKSLIVRLPKGEFQIRKDDNNPAWVDVFASGEYLEMEDTHVEKNENKITWVEINSAGQYEDSQQKNNSKKLLGTVGIIRNVTERKMLEEMRLKYEFIFNRIGAYIALIDRHYRYLDTNEAYSNLFGLPAHEIIGKRLGDLWDKTFYKTVIKPNIDECFHGKAVEYMGQFPAVKGAEGKYLAVVLYPYYDANNEVAQVIVIGIDISNLKKTQEDLENKKNELQELNANLEKRVAEELSKNRDKDILLMKQNRQAIMGEMIGNIAHQWRQPLNTLGLIIQNVKDAYDTGRLTSEYIDRSVRKAINVTQYMSQTIDDFRYFFKPNKEKVEFSLQYAVHKGISFIDATFKNSYIRIDIMDLEDEKNINVYGYPNEYAQVVMNLLNNAKDVLIERNIKNPLVKIELFEEAGKAVLQISDNAGGIDEDYFEKIFDPYFTTKQNGTGIGLYMSKKIIEDNMNGKLTARNIGEAPQVVGAQFRIELPVDKSNESKTP